MKNLLKKTKRSKKGGVKNEWIILNFPPSQKKDADIRPHSVDLVVCEVNKIRFLAKKKKKEPISF